MKMKALAPLLLALLMSATAAGAEYYEGTTSALQETPVYAGSSGTVDSVSAVAGQCVTEGEPLVTIRENKVFADQDGTVVLVNVAESEEADGTVLQVSPSSRYIIYCTSESAVKSPEAMLIHSGETVYVKCSVDGSHRAIGRVTLVDDAEYHVEVLGGTLYVGEKVYLYRSGEFSSSSRVGAGTVLSAETEDFSAQGTIQRLYVSEGDEVEKGQLLFTWTEKADPVAAAPADGIVTAVETSEGAQVNDGDRVMTLVQFSNIGIVFQVDEDTVSSLKTGNTVTWYLTSDAEQEKYTAMVESVSRIGQDGTWQVRLRPEKAPERLGLTVAILTD